MSHLNTIDIIRAWKDPEYRLSLSGAERTQLPAHPAGLIELSDTELNTIAGGNPGLLFGAYSLLAQNYAMGEEGWLTKLGNKIGDDWFEMLN